MRPSAHELLVGIWLDAPPWLRALVHRTGATRLARLRALLPSARRPSRVRHGLLQGMLLDVVPHQDREYFLGSYEPDTQHALQGLLRPGMTGYDIGGHVGFFALAMARLVGPAGHVVTFEPNGAVAERLRRNVELNGLENVEVVPHAVSEHDGVVDFIVPNDDSQGRFAAIAATTDVEHRTVPSTTIDAFVEKGGRVPDVVLIDVEGAEASVLRGMRRTLREGRPSLILELHSKPAAREALEELSRAGYRLVLLPDGAPIAGADEVQPLRRYVATPEPPQRPGIGRRE